MAVDMHSHQMRELIGVSQTRGEGYLQQHDVGAQQGRQYVAEATNHEEKADGPSTLDASSSCTCKRFEA